MAEGKFDRIDDSGESEEQLRERIDLVLDEILELEKRRELGDSAELVEALQQKLEESKILREKLNTLIEKNKRIELEMRQIDGALSEFAKSEEIADFATNLNIRVQAMRNMAKGIEQLLLTIPEHNRQEFQKEFDGIEKRIEESLQNFDPLSRDLKLLKEVEKHFCQHFDELIFLYEKVKDWQR